MRAPSVTIALLIILAIGFGTAALADTGGVPNPSAGTHPTKSTDGTATTNTATTDAGVTTPADGARPNTDTTGDPVVLAPDAPPVLGKSAALTPVSGQVNVKLPGRADYVALADAASIPMGATIDATKGTVRLTSAHNATGTPQSADFHDGTFTVVNQTKGASPVTNLVLKGGDFSACSNAALRTKTAKHPAVRQLWGSGHGRFKTSGRYSAATVHGTIWLTRDTCDGTFTMVKRGIVTVYDKVRRRTVYVKAGQSYFVPAPLPISAATKLIGF